MRAVIQRVNQAEVHVEGGKVAAIQKGLLVLLGITHTDTQEDIDWLVRKILHMRIFSDNNANLNKSILDVDGELLLVSQFTLFASTKKGNRPSFVDSAKPDYAKELYEICIDTMQQRLGKKIGTGIFGADMKVSLENDGPVTICIDTKNKE